MARGTRLLTAALLSAIALFSSGHAAAITVSVNSANSGDWLRSDGGSGTSMPAGQPGVWNAQFLGSIPPGATNISFTLNSFGADDKGVVQLGGSNIGDNVITFASGAAAGAGTFDFGLGGGNLPYNFVGFTPGATFPLLNGTTNPGLVVRINDTGVADPASPPLSVVNISNFGLSGSLTYDLPVPLAAATEVPTLSEWGTMILMALLAGFGLIQARRKRH